MLIENMQAKETVCGENKALCICDTAPIKASIREFMETTLQFQWQRRGNFFYVEEKPHMRQQNQN